MPNWLYPSRLVVAMSLAGFCAMAQSDLPDNAPANVPAPTEDSPATVAESIKATANQQLEGNPYRAIVLRNAFRLKDPLPPPEPPPPAAAIPEVPKIDVKIAGLAEIAGVRYAYLMVPDPDRQGQFEYPALTDDPRQARGVRHRSGIEVREIDLKAQTVRLMNGGIETTLNLKENGVKSAPVVAAKQSGAVTLAAGQQVNVRRPGVSVAPAANATTPQATGGGEPLIFSRSRARAGVETGGNVTQGTARNAGVTGTNPRTSFPSGSVNFPNRTVRTDNVSQVAEQPPPIPFEQQVQVLIEQKRLADSVGVPLPPIPGLPQGPPVQGEPPVQ